MLQIPDVGPPAEIRRIARTAQHEAAVRVMSRRVEEQCVERRLAIRCIGAEIREIGGRPAEVIG